MSQDFESIMQEQEILKEQREQERKLRVFRHLKLNNGSVVNIEADGTTRITFAMTAIGGGTTVSLGLDDAIDLSTALSSGLDDFRFQNRDSLSSFKSRRRA